MLRMPFECSMSNVPDGHGNMTVPPTFNIVLIGAGGTGARVAALLPRILQGRNHQITVVDHDTVEQHNLLRQHFHPNDVGANKAQVVVNRMRVAYPTDEARPNLVAVPMTFDHAKRHMGEAVSRTAHHRLVLVGCVDNPQARTSIQHHFLRYDNVAYIDAGNSTRHGQVVLSFNRMYVQLGSAWLKSSRYTKTWNEMQAVKAISYNGIKRHAPTLLEVPPEDEEACGLRIDTQTVAANQMAATIVGGLLSAVVDQLPISCPYYEFGTNPPIITPTMFNRASAYSLATAGDPWRVVPSGSQ